MMRTQLKVIGLLAAGLLVMALPPRAGSADATPPPSLAQALAQLKVPPDWLAITPVAWDTAKPWKDARLEIRRLLALDDAAVRQGVKLTWLYAQKGDIGDGHELPMYLFMSGNYAWATLEYPRHLKKVVGTGATHAYLCYASCLAHFGEYTQALHVLDEAMNDLPPEPWRSANTANIHNHYGDLYAKMGDLAKAREHYTEAMRLYPTSDQPYGRHLLPRYVAKVKAKLDLLTLKSWATTRLRDGAYTGRALGYSDKKDLEVTVTIRAGKISDVKVKHEEKIDLNATRIIPQRIVEKQSLQVDGVTGATVTSQAIVEGAFRALRQAGLQ
jgi:uncharacterized protein with FMN-binding domain